MGGTKQGIAFYFNFIYRKRNCIGNGIPFCILCKRVKYVERAFGAIIQRGTINNKKCAKEKEKKGIMHNKRGSSVL